MKLRAVTVIWWAVLLFGAVAWCEAQDRENVTQIISHYSAIDSTEARRIVQMEPPVTCPVIKPDIERDMGKPYREIFRLDSSGVVTITDYQLKAFISMLPLLWDEYEKECYADSTEKHEYETIGSHCTVIGIKWYWAHKTPTFKGFMSFIRRKAGE